jgi:hypothetical protein
MRTRLCLRFVSPLALHALCLLALTPVLTLGTWSLATLAQEPVRDAGVHTAAAASATDDPDQLIAALPLGLDPARVIDLAVEQQWLANQLAPAASVDDAQFLRRVSLDLIGRVPRAAEVASFTADTDSRKRELLVDRLLDSDEHAAHFAELLDAILIGRTDVGQYQRRSGAGWMEYLQRALAENRPWNEVARELVLARPAAPEQRGAAWYLYARKDKPQDIAEAVSKDLFGVRIDCAQCHDHPLAGEIEQRHYWGLVAFFNRSKNVDTPAGPRVSESAIGGFSDFNTLEGVAQPNLLVFLGDRQVDEARPAADAKVEDSDQLYHPSQADQPRIPKFSRREKFADEVLQDHPLVAQAMVNRLWGWMLGRGLVHPVDALDSYHPPSHPGLLDWLSRDFAHSGYDVRRMLRALARTRVYQLQSVREGFADPKWFAVAESKPLTAESLHRSLLTALDPDDPGRWNSVEQRIAFARLFPDVLSEETLANVAQGLMLSNAQWINELVTVRHSQTLRSLNEQADPEILVAQLFERLLGRAPDAEELSQCAGYLSAAADRTRAVEGLAWALLTSAEFRFNH